MFDLFFIILNRKYKGWSFMEGCNVYILLFSFYLVMFWWVNWFLVKRVGLGISEVDIINELDLLDMGWYIFICINYGCIYVFDYLLYFMRW